MLGRLLSDLLTRRNATASEPLRRGAQAGSRGDWAAAIAAFRDALARSPDNAEAHNDLGVALAETGQFDAAQECFSRALALSPRLVAARVNLGHLEFQARGRYREAVAHYRAALETEPGLDEARCQCGLALYELGEIEAAIGCFEGVPERSPLRTVARQYCLFATNALPNHSAREHFEDHLRWGARYDALRTAPPPEQPPPPRSANGRLRIGYVSADFREHATASFLLPILEGHDSREFEAFCFANQAEEDALTSRMKRYASAWRKLGSLGDDEAAALIRSDRIDILVDLSGHTRGNRLGVFARRPASVQVTWMGYLNTTGMKAIDWRITDAATDPPGCADACHTERLMRLDPSSWCFRAPDHAPDPGSGPSNANGFVTFGSFNHVAKLNAQVLELWAELLAYCPRARLKIFAVPDGIAAARLAGPFLRCGIARERMEFAPRLPREKYFQALAEVDIALDPFPYSGGATTCDSLWSGVPVIALAGDFGFARTAAAMLALAGLSELVGQTPSDYLARAVRLASDAQRLAALRTTLRARLRASPLMDESGFMRRLEGAYRAMAAGSPRALPC